MNTPTPPRIKRIDLESLGPPIASGGTARVYAYGPDAVLKLYAEGFPDDEAEREAANAKAALAAGVRTPAVRAVVTVAGRPGIIFDRVNSPTLMVGLFAGKDRAAAGMERMANLHADLHSREGSHEAGGFPLLRPRLEHKIRAADLPEASRDFVLARLAALPDGKAICHGDFHPINIFVAEDSAILIDWVDATLGPPLADVARTFLILRHAVLPGNLPKTEFDWLTAERDALAQTYLRAYQARRPFDLSEITAWEPVVAAARMWDRIPEPEQETMRRLCRPLE